MRLLEVCELLAQPRLLPALDAHVGLASAGGWCSAGRCRRAWRAGRTVAVFHTHALLGPHLRLPPPRQVVEQREAGRAGGRVGILALLLRMDDMAAEGEAHDLFAQHGCRVGEDVHHLHQRLPTEDHHISVRERPRRERQVVPLIGEDHIVTPRHAPAEDAAAV